MAVTHLLPLWVLTIATIVVALPAAFGALNISDPGERSQRISGGSVVGKHELPFMVSIQDKDGVHFCGGSIIGREWVLTEAYCIDTDAATYIIVAGAHNFDHPNPHSEQTVRVSAFFKHPSYNPTTYENDIGLIRVTPPFHLNGHSVGTIRLPDSHHHSAPPGKATVAGWGELSHASANSRVLRKVTLELVQDDVCVQVYQHVPEAGLRRAGASRVTAGLTRRVQVVNPAVQVCYYAPGKSQCSGDDGGPLFVADGHGHGRGISNSNSNGGQSDYCQVGIVSNWYQCAAKGFPGIYTRLSVFTTWIEMTIEANHGK